MTDDAHDRAATDARGDARCHCGNLLARLTPRGVEIKCRRCKRVQLVPLTTSSSDRRRGPPRADPSDDNETARGVSPEPGKRRPPGSSASAVDDDD